MDALEKRKLFPHPKIKPQFLGVTTNKSEYLSSFRRVLIYFGKPAKITILFLLFEHTYVSASHTLKNNLFSFGVLHKFKKKSITGDF